MVRHRWLAGAAGLAVLLALVAPALSINTAEPLIGSLPQNGAAAQAFRYEAHHV